MCTEKELLRYPISLLTAAALMESIIEVLCAKYKKDGVDGRGRAIGARDARSVRKTAARCSRGVRLDIRDVLEITEVRVTARDAGAFLLTRSFRRS